MKTRVFKTIDSKPTKKGTYFIMKDGVESLSETANWDGEKWDKEGITHWYDHFERDGMHKTSYLK